MPATAAAAAAAGPRAPLLAAVALFSAGIAALVAAVSLASSALPAPPPPATPARLLSYLPHSGLHNQRLALENALVLAALLNRTLLLPPARLGAPAPYRPSPALARLLRLDAARDGLAHCSLPHARAAPECATHGPAHADVAWTTLFALPDDIPVHAPSGYPALDGTLPPSYALPDSSLYAYQFVDSSLPPRKSRYAARIPISFLASLPAPHLHLGSLHGTSRLRLSSPTTRALRSHIRAALLPAHPALDAAVKNAERRLGGEAKFVGAHVRVADGPFGERVGQTVRGVWFALVQDVL
ncbi:hypothetical protein K488DRAFT_73167, partial [Vararia minispora EC-137]